MGKGKSIITDTPVTFVTPPAQMGNAGWYVDRFENLIQTQGYDAYIDRALRCPCADRNTGQALSTCKNCGGKGWIFVDRTETRLIAQHMDSKIKYQEWSQVNLGTASFTTRGVDKMGFMDRIVLYQLEEYFSEILRPIYYSGEIVAYPIYEPLKITNMYLFVSDAEKLVPITPDMYVVDGNKITFDLGLQDLIHISDVNVRSKSEIPITISIRYSHYPVYHVIDVNRELMKVRENKFCGLSDDVLRQMPINVTARKAHFIFNVQKWGNDYYDNSIPDTERIL